MERFPDEAAARVWLERGRWRGGARVCPFCGGGKTVAVANARPMPYRCPSCRKYFSVTSATALHGSNLSLRKWVLAIHLLSTSVERDPSARLHRELGVTPSTIRLMAGRIRRGWLDGRAAARRRSRSLSRG